MLKAFQNENMLTEGQEHVECDWETMWRERLSEGGKLSGHGWSTTMTVEAHVVNLRDAVAAGNRGLLRPMLKRYQAGGCSVTAFGLPAVQVQFLQLQGGILSCWNAGGCIRLPRCVDCGAMHPTRA